MGNGSLIRFKDGAVSTVTREAETKQVAVAAFMEEMGIRSCPDGYVMCRAIAAPVDRLKAAKSFVETVEKAIGMVKAKPKPAPTVGTAGPTSALSDLTDNRPLPTGPTFPLPSDDD
jgi:hypothetical protein